MIKLENDCDFPDCSRQLLLTKFIKSNTDQKLRDKIAAEKDLEIPKTVEQMKHNSYD